MSESAPQRLPAETGYRLRALRVMKQWPTPAAAVEATGVSISADVWQEIEVPGRPRRMWDFEAEEIARAAGIHPTFFTSPLALLGERRPDQ